MIIWCSTSSPGQLWILNNLFFSLNSLHTIFDEAYFPLFFSISSPGRILPFFILLPSLPSFPPSFLSSFFSFFFLFLNLYSDALGVNFQLSSVAQSCPTLWNPMDCSTPGLPVHHQFPELTQTHVHWVGDVIQPFQPLSSPSPLTFNLSQHQGLFQWVSYSQWVAKVLQFQLQHQSFQWIFRTDFL